MRPHLVQVIRRAFPMMFVAAPAVLSAEPSGAQSVGHYGVLRSTGVAYSSIAATGTSVSTWRNGTSLDDNRSTGIPLGFDFWYDGKAYKGFAISTNGFMDVSGSTASGSGTGAFGAQNTTFSSSVSYTALALTPMYDDLIIPAASSLSNAVKYQITGGAGTHVLTVEWIGVQVKGASSGSLNFQVKLFEADGSIQFNYGTMTNSGVTASYTCGINGPTMSNPPLATQLLTQQTANTATFSGTAQNALSTLPAASSRLHFTAGQTVTPAPPASVTVSNRTQSGARVSWQDNSSTETFFTVQYSLNGINFTTAATVQSGTTATTGTTYVFDLTGLAIETPYSARVEAANEASPPAFSAAIPFITRPHGVYSVRSGKWVDGPTWSTNAMPTSADTVTISDGDVDTLNTSTVVHRLNVGEGTSGVLVYDPSSNRALDVGGDIDVRAGGLVTTPSTGAVANHFLELAGDVHDAGTIDLSTNGGACGGTLFFHGSGHRVLDGAGSVDVRTLTTALADTDSVLTVAPLALTFRDSSTPTAGVLNLNKGVLELAGSYTLSGPLLQSGTIFGSTGLWLHNPNLTITPMASGGLSLNGLLRITQGTMQVGDASNENLLFQAGSSRLGLEVHGGALVVAGGIFGGSGALRFVQDGGLVRVNEFGNPGSGPAFTVGAGTADLKAGTIVLVHANSAGGTPEWSVDSVLAGPSVHVLRIGDDAVPTPQNFRLSGSAWRVEANDVGVAHSVTLNNFTARKGFFGSAPNTVTLVNKVSVFADDFQSTGPLVLQAPTLMLADGYGLPIPGQEGFAPRDLICGSSITGELGTLDIETVEGTQLTLAIPETLLTRNLTLGNGLLYHNGGLALGELGFNTTITVRHGGLASAPLFLPSGGYNLVYTGFTAPDTTGVEVPPARSIRNLTVQGPLTLAGGPLSCLGTIDLERALRTSVGNELVAEVSAQFAPAIGTPGASMGYVDGPLIVKLHTTSTPSALQWFPVGADSLFRPIGLDSLNTSGGVFVDTLQVIRAPGGGVATSPLAMVNAGVAYAISPAGTGLNAGARITLSYDGDDAPWSLGSARVAGSSALAGTYASLGGHVTGGPRQGTIRDTTGVSGRRFFRIGDTSPTVRLIQPNGNQTLVIGQATTIGVQTFASTIVTRVDLFVSRSGPAGPWDPIATAQPESTVYHWVVTGPPTTDVWFRALVKDTLQHFDEDVSDTASSIQTLAATGTDPPGVPGFELATPWPNPAMEAASVAFTLSRRGTVRMSVHDLQGRLIAPLVAGVQEAGRHVATWRPVESLAGGIYLVRLETDAGVLSRRIVLLR